MISDPAALDLLFRLLEAKELFFTRDALTGFYGRAGEVLLGSDLLVPADFEPVVMAADEDDRPAYSVYYDASKGQLGYESLAHGWVSVSQQETERYRLDVDKIFSMLCGDELIKPVPGPVELVAGLIWELGTLRLLQRAVTPVWFARRLFDRSVLAALEQSASRRPATSRRLLLTSTDHEGLAPEFALANAMTVSIRDVIDPYAPFRIEHGRLRARFGGQSKQTAVGPFHLSPDGCVLTIHGTEIHFGGTLQRVAIRFIADAHRRGEGVNAAKLLEAAGFSSSIRTFPQAFRKQWPLLKPYFKSKDKLWFVVL